MHGLDAFIQTNDATHENHPEETLNLRTNIKR